VCFFSKNYERCTATDHDVLSDNETNSTLKREAVCLRINVDKNSEIARKQSVRGYPSTLLTENAGKTIAPTTGYILKKEFKKYCCT
jgi:thioredoxin-related protein